MFIKRNQIFDNYVTIDNRVFILQRGLMTVAKPCQTNKDKTSEQARCFIKPITDNSKMNKKLNSLMIKRLMKYLLLDG